MTVFTRNRSANGERHRADHGFTLIELLVVMIIISILAATAIPIFLNQRKKAHDAAVKTDVATVGKEIGTYYMDGTTIPTIQIVNDRYHLNGKDIGPHSKGVNWVGMIANDYRDWCVCLQNPDGAIKTWSYSAQRGLAAGDCSGFIP